MFDFKELEAFVWVVRLGSFRKGAARLHITQPSISDRLTRLKPASASHCSSARRAPCSPPYAGASSSPTPSVC